MKTKSTVPLTRLIKKSDAGEVVWSNTSNKDGFKLQLKDSVLCIMRKVNEGRAFYSLWIYNSNGDVIVNQNIDSSIMPNKFRALYESARRVFYKEDATLESILKQVNSPSMIGESDDLPF
jgi:hypothetical protein